MSALSRAQTRLEQAVARLEKALGEHEARSAESSGSEDVLHEVQALRDECRDLRGKLDRANRRHAHLQTVVSEVSVRLDGSITELDQMLER
ncbi:MAG: DUF4164 family protein [Geminicoccaceae bacterium]|nr:DUF4164 family protein [Geminicoccaceae bacterium]MCB9944931.1 DUF4164 family protein [Geminicoccaceae bacterium]